MGIPIIFWRYLVLLQSSTFLSIASHLYWLKRISLFCLIEALLSHNIFPDADLNFQCLMDPFRIKSSGPSFMCIKDLTLVLRRLQPHLPCNQRGFKHPGEQLLAPKVKQLAYDICWCHYKEMTELSPETWGSYTKTIFCIIHTQGFLEKRSIQLYFHHIVFGEWTSETKGKDSTFQFHIVFQDLGSEITFGQVLVALRNDEISVIWTF